MCAISGLFYHPTEILSDLSKNKRTENDTEMKENSWECCVLCSVILVSSTFGTITRRCFPVEGSLALPRSESCPTCLYRVYFGLPRPEQERHPFISKVHILNGWVVLYWHFAQHVLWKEICISTTVSYQDRDHFILVERRWHPSFLFSVRNQGSHRKVSRNWILSFSAVGWDIHGSHFCPHEHAMLPLLSDISTELTPKPEI